MGPFDVDHDLAFSFSSSFSLAHFHTVIRVAFNECITSSLWLPFVGMHVLQSWLLGETSRLRTEHVFLHCSAFQSVCHGTSPRVPWDFMTNCINTLLDTNIPIQKQIPYLKYIHICFPLSTLRYSVGHFVIGEICYFLWWFAWASFGTYIIQYCIYTMHSSHNKLTPILFLMDQ